MFLIVHAAAGALIGESLNPPLLSFASGIGSHALLDIIPHGDEIIGRLFVRKGCIKWLVALAFIDVLAAASLVVVLWMAGLFPNAAGALAGALGSILPDVLVGLSELSHGKLWPDFTKLHMANHRLLGVEVPVLFGFSIQAITLWAIIVGLRI